MASFTGSFDLRQFLSSNLKWQLRLSRAARHFAIAVTNGSLQIESVTVLVTYLANDTVAGRKEPNSYASVYKNIFRNIKGK